MKNRSTIAAISLVVIFIIIAIWVRNPSGSSSGTATTTDSSGVILDSSVSDGTIIVPYSSALYILATKPTEVFAQAYIPPCDQYFIYCLYATSTVYKGTNFETAGLRIQKRVDLKSELACLDTPPEGYADNILPNVSTSTDAYSSSGFLDRGDAGAGHYSYGSLYRVFNRANKSCYEFETRVGETQFANYPEGTIKEFTKEDRERVTSILKDILNHITLQSGQSNLFAF